MRKGDDAKAHKELNALGGDGGGEKEMDTGKAQDALAQLESAAAAEKAARLERERELAKVKIDSQDVKLIMDGTCVAALRVRACALQTSTGGSRLRKASLARVRQRLPVSRVRPRRAEQRRRSRQPDVLCIDMNGAGRNGD